MPYETKYELGQHNVICAVCQSHFKSRMIRRNWQGLLVCDADWDPRPAGLLDKPRVVQDPRPVDEIQGPEDIRYKAD